MMAPPSSMASRAFTARFSRAFCNSRIPDHDRILGGQVHLQGDPLVDGALEDRDDRVDAVVDGNRGGGDLSLAGEGQQLPGEVGGAGGRIENNGGKLGILGIVAQPPVEHFGGPDDAGQHVVEIMGNTACQLPDDIHPLIKIKTWW